MGRPITGGCCCCFEAALESQDIRFVCDATFPCADIEFECTAPEDLFCDETPLTTGCTAAIDCALGVLIAGESAGIRWSLDHRGWRGEESALYLAGDGTAFLQRLSYADVSAGFDNVDRAPLKSRAYFEACAQRSTAAERFECIQSARDEGSGDHCVDAFDFDWY